MSLCEPTFDKEKWGFYIDENGYMRPLWTLLPKVSKACKELYKELELHLQGQ